MIKSGVEVNVIHHTNQALEGFNESHVNKLIQKLKDEGVKFTLVRIPSQLNRMRNVL